MALGKNRSRIFVRGLGNLELIEKEPTADTVPKNAGWIKSAKVSITPEMQDVKSDTGFLINSIEKSTDVSIEAGLLQTTQDEIDLIRNASTKIYACRYSGLMPGTSVFQYHCMENGKLIPLVNLPYEANERILPLKIHALKQSDLSYDVPLLYVQDLAADIKPAEMVGWITPRQALNTGTTKILDISGFGKHGTLNSDYASMWQTLTAPEKFIRFDGSNDYIDLGDNLDVPDATSFLIAFWINVKGADGALQEILSKKSADAHEAGFRIVRNTSNKIEVKLSDGVDSVTTTGATSLITTTGWKHVAFQCNRSGDTTQIYLNGVADGSAGSSAAIGTMLNAVSYYIGRFITGYGQFDFGGLQQFHFEAGTVKTTAEILALYNAEKTAFGL